MRERGDHGETWLVESVQESPEFVFDSNEAGGHLDEDVPADPALGPRDHVEYQAGD